MRAASAPLLAALFLSCADGGGSDPVATANLATEVPVCHDIKRSGTLRLAPASPELQYRRCGTVAGENGWSVRLSPDHQRMAALTNVGTVRLIATADWTEIVELASPLGEFDSLAFSPDGALLATLATEAGQVTFWSARDGRLIRSVEVGPIAQSQPEWGASLLFSSDGKQLATSRQTLIDLTTFAVKPWSAEVSGSETTDRVRGIRPIRMDFVDGGRQILAYGRQQLTNMVAGESFWLTDLATGRRTVLHSNSLGALDFAYALSDDKRLLAYAGRTASASGLLLLEAGKTEPIAVDPLGGLTVLAFSRDARELYTLTQNEIEVLEVPSLKSLRRFAWTFAARFVALSPDGLLVARTERGTEWWDPRTGQRVRTLPSVLSYLTWSADGALSAGAATDTLLHVWREADGDERCRIPKPTVTFPTLRPRPTIQPPTPRGPTFGPWIASQTADGAIAFMQGYAYHFGSTDWYTRTVEEVATKKVLRTFLMTNQWNVRAELSDDGSTLITAEDDYMARWCR